MEKLNVLYDAIKEAGLVEIATTSPAYDAMTRIVENGHDVPCRWDADDKEMNALFDEDTAETARVLSNPGNWGISDPRWQTFCQEFGA